MKMFVFFPV